MKMGNKAMLRGIILLVSVAVLSACVTTEITTKKAFEGNDRSSLDFTDISVEATPESGASHFILSSLKSLVYSRISAMNLSGDPARLHMVVTHVKIVPNEDRLIVGALAGPNELNVTATVVSKSDNQVLAEFDVIGEFNPAAMGAFSNQEIWTADSVAESLVEAIYDK